MPKHTFLPALWRGLLCPYLLVAAATAEPVIYDLEPGHSYPSFEADHMGISLWRGKFNSTAGEVLLDREAQTGTVTVTVDVNSVDFGHDGMNEKAVSGELFNTREFPQAMFKGELLDFSNGAPTRLAGNLTLHGVTAPVELAILSFRCINHPMLEKEVCGADARGAFERDLFGLDLGKNYGFDMTVNLQIQVEAIRRE